MNRIVVVLIAAGLALPLGSCSPRAIESADGLMVCEALIRHTIASPDKSLQEAGGASSFDPLFLLVRDDPKATRDLIARFQSESLPVRDFETWPDDPELLAALKAHLARAGYEFIAVDTSGEMAVVKLGWPGEEYILDWGPVPSQFGGRQLVINRVVINGDVATVSGSMHWAPLAAHGLEYLLRRTKDGWEVQSCKVIWIS